MSPLHYTPDLAQLLILLFLFEVEPCSLKLLLQLSLDDLVMLFTQKCRSLGIDQE